MDIRSLLALKILLRLLFFYYFLLDYYIDIILIDLLLGFYDYSDDLLFIFVNYDILIIFSSSLSKLA
jgi:hypothetical protein